MKPNPVLVKAVVSSSVTQSSAAAERRITETKEFARTRARREPVHLLAVTSFNHFFFHCILKNAWREEEPVVSEEEDGEASPQQETVSAVFLQPPFPSNLNLFNRRLCLGLGMMPLPS